MEQSLIVDVMGSCQILGGVGRSRFYQLLRDGWYDSAGRHHRLESRWIGRRHFVTRRSLELLAFGVEDDTERGVV